MRTSRWEGELRHTRRDGSTVVVASRWALHSLGHHAGDQLLVEVAARLSKCLRSIDTVARQGGDEFTILLENIVDSAEAERVAERVHTALRSPVVIGGQEVFVRASIGIALSGAGQSDADTLMRNADLALYQSKAGGKSRHSMYGSGMRATSLERLELETDLPW